MSLTFVVREVCVASADDRGGYAWGRLDLPSRHRRSREVLSRWLCIRPGHPFVSLGDRGMGLVGGACAVLPDAERTTRKKKGGGLSEKLYG